MRTYSVGYLQIVVALAASFLTNAAWGQESDAPPSFSGIYPRLAQFNDENECGTGAVVAWAGKLWTISYGPHLPNGSSDKLYEISPDLTRVVRAESVGGTNANRMIHRESNQLFIGNHAIDASGNVRTIPHKDMPGRITSVARSLTDPANKVYFLTMEEGLYEVDVHTLEVREIYKDGNAGKSAEEDVLPGYHGKGGYTSQGRVVYANNGENSEAARRDPTTESGCLAEWFGEERGWNVVERKQFTEVTTKDGIYGGATGKETLWSLGWDARSVILEVLEDGTWSRFRLPKASHCYDGAHGWNTEWPRIRKMNMEENYLATMHGTFWRFPSSFSASAPGGIRPISTYLKVIGDFEFWNDKLVFGCDDSAKSEFLNKSPFKNAVAGPGRSNSNLWFVEPGRLRELGAPFGRGAVWLNDTVEPDVPSDPYLFSGYSLKCAFISFESASFEDDWKIWDVPDEDLPDASESETAPKKRDVWLDFEVMDGSGNWNPWRSVKIEVEATGDRKGAAVVYFDEFDNQPWIRIRSKSATLTGATCVFHYSGVDLRSTTPSRIFKGVASAKDASDFLGARLWTRGDVDKLAVVSQIVSGGELVEERYYELDEDGRLERVVGKFEGGDEGTISRVKAKVDATPVPADVCAIDELSVLAHYRGARYRLPIGSEELARVQTPLTLRLDREVATERDLFNCAGIFYELPAENAGGLPKIRPIATHNLLISDYASYRGLLVLAGIVPEEPFTAPQNEHVVRSVDGGAALWLGALDDLWSLGRARGKGSVWLETAVKANEPSDPMLATGFVGKKSVHFKNLSDHSSTIWLEADPTGNGDWRRIARVDLEADSERPLTLDSRFQAYWLRVVSEQDATLTATFEYE